MSKNTITPILPNKSPGNLLSALKKHWAMLAVLVIFILFPFVFTWITKGSPLVGPSKFWQGQLIAFFILAVFAMSYDLVMGYTGILSFGHAAFYGSGAYTMAIFYKHFAPKILGAGNFHVQIGSVDFTEALLFIFALLSCFLCNSHCAWVSLFTAVSRRVKGVYFAMITLAMADAIYLLIKSYGFC